MGNSLCCCCCGKRSPSKTNNDSSSETRKGKSGFKPSKPKAVLKSPDKSSIMKKKKEMNPPSGLNKNAGSFKKGLGAKKVISRGSAKVLPSLPRVSRIKASTLKQCEASSLGLKQSSIYSSVLSRQSTSKMVGRYRLKGDTGCLTKTFYVFRDSSQIEPFCYEKTNLYKEQKRAVAVTTGGKVNKRKCPILKQAEVNEMQAHLHQMPPEHALIIQPPYSTLHEIVPGLYITSLYGLTRETLTEAKVRLMVNATIELPLGKHALIRSVRVPVDDDPNEPLQNYFNDVADLIEETRLGGNCTVVHCVAGASRSATLVLAYLLKYTDMCLQDAFIHTITIRECIKPNLGFMQQLIEYEQELNGDSSTKMVQVKNTTTGASASIPDFYQKACPKLYQAYLINKS